VVIFIANQIGDPRKHILPKYSPRLDLRVVLAERRIRLAATPEVPYLAKQPTFGENEERCASSDPTGAGSPVREVHLWRDRSIEGGPLVTP